MIDSFVLLSPFKMPRMQRLTDIINMTAMEATEYQHQGILDLISPLGLLVLGSEND